MTVTWVLGSLSVAGTISGAILVYAVRQITVLRRDVDRLRRDVDRGMR